MNRTLALCAAAIVSLGLAGGAGAQALDDPAPDDSAPPEASAQPPDAPAAPAPEAPPSAPPEAAPAAPPEAPPAPAAAPAAFGKAWHYAISVERVFGIDHVSTTESNYGAEVRTTSGTNFSLFGDPTSGALSVFSFPRAAFDLFVIPDLSVGLALGVFKGSTTLTESGGGSTTESFTGLAAMPRVGYAWHIAPDVALWPRVGLSVVYVKTNLSSTYTSYSSGNASSHYVAATVEAPFVFTLVPQVALTVGPTLDITFVGKSPPAIMEAGGQPSYDTRITEFGIQVGLLINI